MPITPTIICIFLFAIGLVLIVGEMLLPTHGTLGIVGGGAMLGAIGIGFHMSQWIGESMLIVTLLCAPIAMTIWPKTVGRRMILPTTETLVHPPRVGLGQIGVAVSELRPMGWCEFADQRHEARAETNIIRAGAQVKVVSVESGRLIVRQV
jgi:membrane-bound ClpP family serine protease